ncbi:MAG: hypothetical protein R2778_11725 [Saprospiraceae bacterium]
MLSTIMGNGGDCDTMITYTLEWLPAPMRDEIIQFCPGTSVDIDGVLYDQPGTVMSTITGVGGCDTLVTYTLEWLPYETASEMLFFCPGQTVVIGAPATLNPVQCWIPLHQLLVAAIRSKPTRWNSHLYRPETKRSSSVSENRWYWVDRRTPNPEQ